ncbi:MAG: 60S ribosomal protein L31 [Candidatus Aenigmarchaeota archaeon]|nr:60S ribosomal protein L31 [Candidatus Aenigmarchaeota archaeon]
MAEKRLYTIPLRDAWNVSIKKRSKRAMSVIRIFAERHMKTDSVKIGAELNHLIWSRGIKNPPRKVKVQMVPAKTDDAEVVWVDVATSSMDYLKTDKEKKKEEKKSTVKAAPKTAATETKKETEAEPKKTDAKAEAKPKTAPKKAEPKKATADTKTEATKAKPKAAPKAAPKAEVKTAETKKAAPAKK